MAASTTHRTRKSSSRPLTFDYVRGLARGRWKEIASSVFGIDAHYLDGKHGPCPICNEGTKRWRVFKDFDDAGGAICNDCSDGKNWGDGFKLGAAKLGLPVKEVLRLVAKHIGVEGGDGGGSSYHSGKSEDPAKQLTFDTITIDGVSTPDTSLLPYFCLRKRPITMAAITRCHGRQARYRNQHSVLALPVWGEQLAAAAAIGWTMYAVPAGTLPTWPKKGGPTVQVKIKTTYGSQPGWIGPVEELAAATHVWKLEGPSDLLAWWSLANIPAGHIALTNCNGAGELPKPWMLKMLAGKTVYVLHDADKAGEEGALGAEGSNGRRKAGWLELLAREGIEAFQVKLPYEVEEKHGKDLRDFVNERESATLDFSMLLSLGKIPYVLPADLAPVATSNDDTSNDRQPITNADIITEDDDDGNESQKTVPVEMNDIVTRIFLETEGWPKRVGESLFTYDKHSHAIRWIKSTPSLFGWLGEKCGVIRWYRAVGCHTKEEVYQQVTQRAESFLSVETLPHEPPIANHYYATEDLPDPTGEHISNLIARFSPATTADRWLLLAMFATAFWGGRGGSRPMFVITSDSGRGAGKTKLSDVLSHLAGGCIELSANEDAGIMRQRLLSPGGKNKRIARLDNVKSLRFSWADLESLITVPVISGKEMYVGEGSRPNNLTWIITLNGPSLSTDIAQRAVIVKLDRPIRNPRWEEETLAYIDQHRLSIIADIIACLSLPPQPIDCQTRWAAWEYGVLSRLRCHTEGITIASIQETLKHRSGESDAEGEEAELIEEAFKLRLEQVGYASEIDKIHLPTHVAAEWFNEATNERRSVQAASRMLAQLITEGRLKFIGKNPSRTYGRGFLWNSKFEGDARYDIEERIRNSKLREIENRERARLEIQNQVWEERKERNRLY